MSLHQRGKFTVGIAALIMAVVVLAGCVEMPPPPPPVPVTDVRINEVESNGGTPGDWIELTNLGPDPADISGYTVLDNDDTHTPLVIPAGTVLAPGAYYVVEEAALGFGLGSADSARLFDTTGAVVDSYSWTAHAVTTYGRCPDGTGAFTTNVASTKGAANSCPGPVTTLTINEIESNGGTPGDWVELTNTGPIPIDVSGFTVLDGDDTHTALVIPAGTTIAPGAYYLVEEAALGFGLGAADNVRVFDPTGALYQTYAWTAHAATTYGRCPNGTGAFTTTTSSTKGALNDCGNPVKINEVESSGGSPGDFIELINPGANPADISGFSVNDNDDTHTPLVIPAGTVLAPGAYYLVEEAALGFGLGSADSARLFDTTGALVDTYAWTAHAATTYGRCPNGTGAFTTTTASTKGAVNACPGDVVTSPWPGDAATQTADGVGVLGGNMSGLDYEGSGSATPGVLWAVKNGPGTLYRLVSDGTTWAPDTNADWGAGKALKYADGTGNPDAEGVTFAGTGSSAGIFVATERNNDVSGTSKNAILRFDPAAPGTTINANAEWDLTSDLPAVGPNLGLEAITWIPDTVLVANGFVDQTTGLAYDPATYPNHGTGLFFVGVEANGAIYGYALDQAGTGFTRVATIASGFIGVMDLQYDAELDNFWAVCDDGCQGRSTVLGVNGAGAYVPGTVFDRPGTMANLNNEGFAFAPIAECVADRRPVFWADDSATGGNAIRSGKISCSAP
jgi:hypothetical protein